jgi:predicted permease
MPNWKSTLSQRLADLKLDPTREAEIIEELTQHLDDRFAELLTSGETPDRAEQLALEELSGRELLADGLRPLQKGQPEEPPGINQRANPLEGIAQDLRYSIRSLRKRPGFTFVVVLVITLGIGATTAIFSVVNGVLLRPLPYPDSLRLMTFIEQPGRYDNFSTMTAPDFLEVRRRCTSCANFAAHMGTQPANMSGNFEAERVRVGRITDNVFATLGVNPLFGRSFVQGEMKTPLPDSLGETSGSTVAILSYGLWQRRFAGDRDVLGKVIKINGDSCEIIGVMPKDFSYPEDADAWLPASLIPNRNNSYLQVVFRLRPAVKPAQAQTEIQAISQQLKQETGDKRAGLGGTLVSLHEQLVGDVRRSLLIFLGAVILVLLIACANVANLLLANATSRQKEMAVRAALGANRLRIVRQSLTESLLLALVGGACGLVLALGLLRLFLLFAPKAIPRFTTIAIDPWVLGFTLLLSILTGVIFGTSPALQTARLDLNSTLKEGTRSPLGFHFRLRSVLIVVEVSLALVLLTGAGLLLRSFMNLRQTKLGFNPDHVLLASVSLPVPGYPTTNQIKQYYQQALMRLSQRNEVQSIALANSPPFNTSGVSIRGSIAVEGETEDRQGVFPNKIGISGNYFQAMGIPILKGRDFNGQDNENSTRVVIVSESLARQLWGNDNPLGKRIDIGLPGEKLREVVGVVGDVKQRELDAPPVAALYQPFLQASDKLRWFIAEMSFVVRTNAEPGEFIPVLREELKLIDSDLPLHNVSTMETIVSDKAGDPRFYALLLVTFSGLALILAAAGIYSIISYWVAQRTHELGIRVALGARSGSIFRLVVRQAMTLTLIGVVLGLGASYLLTRVLKQFVFDVSTTDPSTFTAVAALLIGVALVACVAPARKATMVDPLIALRQN